MAGDEQLGGHWVAYAPTTEAPWDLRRVAHLHRRAAFAATWDELQRDLKDGPQKSIDRLLDGRPREGDAAKDFERTAAVLADAAVAADSPARLRAWWVYRMLFTPDPLGERLAFLWHNHFATSAAKVGTAVRAQNEVFRRAGRAPFGELLGEAARDPALLLWLDAQANRKGAPNENLARELMELFTLGVGNYSEKDVKEAARCLTGWTVNDGRFREDPAVHDGGEKTVLGKTGRWRGGDLVRVLLDHPATARRLAWRICDWLMGEGAASEAAVAALAAGLRERKLDVGWAAATVLRSRLFFAATNIGNRVLGPVEFVVGAARALELFDPPPSTLALAGYAAGLGQDLFHPPNVGGWPGGRAWLDPRTAVGRANYAAALVGGEAVGLSGPVDALALARRRGRAGRLETVVGFYAELLLGGAPDGGWLDRLVAALGPKPAAEPRTVRRAVALVLASPEAQLG